MSERKGVTRRHGEDSIFLTRFVYMCTPSGSLPIKRRKPVKQRGTRRDKVNISELM